MADYAGYIELSEVPREISWVCEADRGDFDSLGISCDFYASWPTYQKMVHAWDNDDDCIDVPDYDEPYVTNLIEFDIGEEWQYARVNYSPRNVATFTMNAAISGSPPKHGARATGAKMKHGLPWVVGGYV